MKYIKLLLPLIFFTLFITKSFSAETVAVLDVRELLKNSKAAIAMKDQLNAVAKKYTEEDQKQQKEIQKKEEELLRQKSTLTPEAFSDRKNAFEKTVIEFNKSSNAKRKALSKAEKDAISQIEDEVEKIVKQISETDKISAVIRKSAIILSDPTLDITQKVVDELNKKLSSVKVNVTP